VATVRDTKWYTEHVPGHFQNLIPTLSIVYLFPKFNKNPLITFLDMYSANRQADRQTRVKTLPLSTYSGSNHSDSTTVVFGEMQSIAVLSRGSMSKQNYFKEF